MIVKPILSPAEAVEKIRTGDTVMFGGFMGCGTPDTLIRALIQRGTRPLTMICNDTAIHNFRTGKITGVAHLVLTRQVERIITSHIGLNQETQRQMNAGETIVDLIPQGTLAEQVRSAGAGLGGVLTPTGVGTEVEEGKQVIELDGRPYLLERPIRGDVALLKAKKADRAGNLVYHGTGRNFNPLMATAAKVVIAEVEEVVETGDIDPDAVHTPGIFVDFLVKSETVEG